MADLTANDITVNMTSKDVDFLQFNKMVFPTITFGDGAKTYGSGNGIPLPDLDKFELKQEIKRGKVTPAANGYVYCIDRANHKLQIFYGDYSESADGPLVEVPSSHAPAATTLELELIGQ